VPPNGLELSCPAARATADSFSRILAGKALPKFPPASRVSCSELLGIACRLAWHGLAGVASLPWEDHQHEQDNDLCRPC